MEFELARAIVFARDMDAMVAFYQGVLGLEEVITKDTGEGWRVFRAGTMELALHAIPAPIAAEIRIADPPEARSSAVTKLVFRVDDLAGTRRALQAQGATEVHQEFLSDPPVRCDFLDPEGNVFQISSL